jgi:hypothetical protein
VIHEAFGRPVPVELSGDPRMGRRVRRLAATSVVALGLIWALARTTLGIPAAIEGLLLAGWVLMPSSLVLSLAVPRTRYLLAVPASLVTVGLAWICLEWLPAAPLAAAGWLLLTGGIALGGWLGIWLWYRAVPVPAWLDDPEAPGRWTLIAIHVGLVAIGWTLAATALAAA